MSQEIHYQGIAFQVVKACSPLQRRVFITFESVPRCPLSFLGTDLQQTSCRDFQDLRYKAKPVNMHETILEAKALRGCATCNWGWKSSFGFSFHIIVHHWRISGQKLKNGKILEAETDSEAMEDCYLLTWSVCFLIPDWPHPQKVLPSYIKSV